MKWVNLNFGLHPYMKKTLYIILSLYLYCHWPPTFFLEMDELYIINYGVVILSVAWGFSAPEPLGNTPVMLLPLLGVSVSQASLQGWRGFSWWESFIYLHSPHPWRLSWLQCQDVSYDALCRPAKGSSYSVKRSALSSIYSLSSELGPLRKSMFTCTDSAFSSL